MLSTIKSTETRSEKLYFASTNATNFDSAMTGDLEISDVLEYRKFCYSQIKKAVERLPICVAVNESLRHYNIRDSRGIFIWADDLPCSDDELIEDMSMLFANSARSIFRKAFSSEARIAAYNAKQLLSVPLKMLHANSRLSKQVVVSMRFVPYSEGSAYEIYFERGEPKQAK